MNDNPASPGTTLPASPWKADNPNIPVKERIRALKARMKSHSGQAQKHADLAQTYARLFEADAATLAQLQEPVNV